MYKKINKYMLSYAMNLSNKAAVFTQQHYTQVNTYT